jgi:ribonuclease Z
VRLRILLLFALLAVVLASWFSTCLSWRYEDVAAGVEALESRRFERLTLVTLGTGGAFENHLRQGPTTAVGAGGRVVLVDAGRAVAERLRAAAIPVAQPDTVFVTRLLPENVVGLDDLLLTGWLAPRSVALRVVGPAGTAALVERLGAAHAGAIEAQARLRGLPLEGARFEALEVGEGWSEERLGLRVSAAALPGGPIPALAFRFEAEGRSLVVGTASWGRERLLALATGADALVHDGLYTETLEAALEAGVRDPERVRREAELSTPLRETARLAEQAGVRTLVLVRLVPPPLLALQFRRVVGEHFSGRIVVAEDGEEITP